MAVFRGFFGFNHPPETFFTSIPGTDGSDSPSREEAVFSEKCLNYYFIFDYLFLFCSHNTPILKIIKIKKLYLKMNPPPNEC